ncbi:MAG: hypothetical protein JWO46_1792 [Nocardioidaceae bacterium]|nr:hypothetical protein [Nocardioidaceae bacterium]
MATMPAHTQRHHFEPPWRGDGPHGIDVTSHDKPGPDGLRCIDQNYQVTRDLEPVCMHWARPRQNNYRYILNPGAKRARKMTVREANRPVSRWTLSDVRRWRRTAAADSARPHTYAELAAYAVKHGVTICAEMKSGKFARDDVAARFVASAKAVGHAPWGMALYGSMARCAGKCRAVIDAGGEFAVIYGRYRKRFQPVFKRTRRTWLVQPTRVW